MSTSIRIKGQEKNSSYSYKTLDFSSLRYGFNNSECLINYDGFMLKDYVGIETYTGNELLYYPELAKAMRKSVKEYPTMARKYDVNKEIKGLEFVNYLAQRLNEVAKLFENERNKANETIENLVNHFGQNRVTPIIDKIIEADSNWKEWKTGLIINGVTWLFKNESKSEELLTVVNMREFLNLSYSEFEKVELEDAIIGTPFVAFRIGKAWRNTGSLHWYNLDTMQEVKKAEMNKWTTSKK